MGPAKQKYKRICTTALQIFRREAKVTSKHLLFHLFSNQVTDIHRSITCLLLHVWCSVFMSMGHVLKTPGILEGENHTSATKGLNYYTMIGVIEIPMASYMYTTIFTYMHRH